MAISAKPTSGPHNNFRIAHGRPRINLQALAAQPFVPMVRERAARNGQFPGHRPLPWLCVHRLAAFEIRVSDACFSSGGAVAAPLSG